MGGIGTALRSPKKPRGVMMAAMSGAAQPQKFQFFRQTLHEADPELAAAIDQELGRQREKIELIASENIVSRAVLEAQGSVLTNKYAEGYPSKRYYGGCEFVDIAENAEALFALPLQHDPRRIPGQMGSTGRLPDGRSQLCCTAFGICQENRSRPVGSSYQGPPPEQLTGIAD